MSRSENEVMGSSSGEEEEEEVSSEEEGSGSESELGNKNSSPPGTPPTGGKNPSSAPSKKHQPVPASSSDESESEESESEPDADQAKNSGKADPNIKPLASKPMDDEPLKKARSKNPTVRYSPPASSKPAAGGGKRAAPASDGGKDSKRSKKAVVAVPAPDAEKKQQLFQRVWSEEDEVILINGMISYVEKRNKDPIAHLEDFYVFVKKLLHIEVNTKQMLTKLRRLKKKFENNAGREQQKGKVRSFSKPHEMKMYELSKRLWGGEDNNNAIVVGGSAKPRKNQQKGKGKKAVVLGNGTGIGNGIVNGLESVVEAGDDAVRSGAELGKVVAEDDNVVRSGAVLSQIDLIGLPITGEDIMKKGLELLSGIKKKEMEEKWNKLKVQELEQYLKKVELVKEQGQLLLDAVKQSGGS